jgi:hypothetical protein
MKPQNFPEQVIWYSIIGTYAFYFLGGLYILGPAIAWILLFYFIKKLWQQNETTPEAEKIVIPLAIWLWIAGMIIEEVALIAGHLDFNLGTAEIIKSSIGWAKGWALMAIFPLIGCLPIRPQLLYRATCIVCLQSLLYAPICIFAYMQHLPATLYTSPLKIVGGPGPEFFQVSLYGIDPGNNLPRWSLFTPWAPALGFVADIYFFLSLQEKNNKWRWCGIVGSIIMCLMSQSRLALLCLPIVLLATWTIKNLSRPVFLILMGFASTVTGIVAPTILQVLATFSEQVKSSRASSTRVRAALWEIALQRWREAPIWGHGVVERGPKLVENMMIGTHSTIASLLFVKGAVGFIAFAIPMLYSFIDLLIKAQKNKTAAVGLSISLVLIVFTFGENLEMLAYLYWPGLVMMGISLQPQHFSINSHKTYVLPKAIN